jgi:hypothetical protein
VQNKIILIIVGAAVVLIGVIVLRLIRNGLERKRLADEQDKNKGSLHHQKNEADAWPARLKLVKTPKALIFEAILEKAWAQENITFTPLDNIDLSSRDFQKTVRLKETVSQNIYRNKKKFSETVTIFDLARTQVLGRDKNCDIVLSEINVSRSHALIKFEMGNYVLYDISSTAGISLNSGSVSSQGAILKPNDLIIIGLTVLIFEGHPPDGIDKSEQ